MTIRVSSSRSRGEFGAGITSESLISFSLRATSGGSFIPSKRVAAWAIAVVSAMIASLACAERISVSSVM